MKWGKAYTLIEVLVVLTIIGILFGFGYISFRDFARRQALSGAAKQLQVDARLAQSESLGGKKPSICTENLDSISFRVSDGGYQVEADCGALHPIIGGPTVFPSDISVSALPSPNPIRFKVLGQGTNIDSGGTAQITLRQNSTGNTASITITAGGEIQ